MLNWQLNARSLQAIQLILEIFIKPNLNTLFLVFIILILLSISKKTFPLLSSRM